MVKSRIVPEGKGDNENYQKAIKIVEERNKEIAKIFGMEPNNDLLVSYYQSAGALSGRISSAERSFMGYVDHEHEILLIHPDGANGLFTDLWSEMALITDYVLVKYYVCQKYFPNKEDFKLYYKYISDAVASIISGKYQDSVAKFEFKMYTAGKKLKKDTEIGVVLYIMKKFSGVEFIVENLQQIFDDRKISETVSKIYNKNLDDLILPLKEEVIEEERKQRELEKQKRQQQFNETKNAQRPGSQQGKFVTRDKFKQRDDNKSNDDRNRNNNHNRNHHNNNNRNHSNNNQNRNYHSKERQGYEKAQIDPSKI